MLSTGFPVNEADHCASFVRGSAKALIKRGHLVHVVAPSRRARDELSIPITRVRYAPRSLERTFHGAGVPDNVRDPRAWLGLGTFPLALSRAARDVAARFRPEVVVSHFGVPCALAAPRGVRQLVVWHSADVHLASRFPALAERALRAGDRHWFVSEDKRALLGRREDDVVCPMGFAPVPRLDRAEAKRALRVSKFCALTLSRLVPIKNVGLAIDAVAKSGHTLLVAGDGTERAHLEKRALARCADVRFLGHVSGHRKALALSAADALVLPSKEVRGRAEGAPIALLEAMSAALPAVFTGYGGDDALAVGIRARTANEIARALKRLERDEGERTTLGQHARLTSGRYTWDVVGERMSALIRALATRP